jgi:hypothetical protein
MGHEYIEMKNSNAAIEAYRRAAGSVLLNVIIFAAIHVYACRHESERLPGMVWSCASL